MCSFMNNVVIIPCDALIITSVTSKTPFKLAPMPFEMASVVPDSIVLFWHNEMFLVHLVHFLS